MMGAMERRMTAVGTGGRILTGAGLLFVLGMDAVAVWMLSGLGMNGLRDFGGWGMLMVGIVLVAIVAVNLLVLIALLLRAQMRRIESTSERS